MYGSVVALQEHLGDTCCSPEVSVNLERRMRVEEVGECAAVGVLAGGILVRQQLQHVLDDGKGVVAVEHTRPEAYLPPEAPSCSLVATVGECLLGCGEKIVVAVGGYLVGREQAVEVGYVAVVLVVAVSVDEPFLQLFPASYLHRRNLVEGGGQTVDVGGVLTQNLCRFHGVGQCVEHNLVVHGATGGDGGRLTGWPLLGTY